MKEGDMLWIFLSLLTLPVDKQIYLIGGLMDDDDIVQDKFFVSNSKLLTCALSRFCHSWVDEGFNFFLDIDSQTNSSLYQDFQKAISEAGGFNIYKKDFITRIEWHNLRHVAEVILEKSGLPACNIAEPIDFNDFMEMVVDPVTGGLWIEW
jgi:hypothetical protein